MALPAMASGLTAAYKAIPDSAKTEAVAWVKNATTGAVSTAKQMLGYAKSSDNAAFIVAEGLVRSGGNAEYISRLFSGSANGLEIRKVLLSIGSSLMAQEDAGRPGLGSNGESAIDEVGRDVMRRELVESLTRAFGSISAARKVQTALATLRQSDFDWYSRVVLKQG